MKLVRRQFLQHAGAVAALMASLFITSSVQILRQAWQEYKSSGTKLDGHVTTEADMHHT